MVEQNGAHVPTPEEQFEARLTQVFQKALDQAMPAIRAGIKQEVLAEAEAAIGKRVQEARAEVDAYKGQQLSPATSSSPVEDTPKSLADAIRWGIAYLPKALAESLDTYDKLVTIRMKQQNPAIVMGEWAKTNPDMLAFYAQKYAPDPLQNYLPGLLAKNSLDTANAVAKVLVRQGMTGRNGGGRFAVDPFDEPSE